MRRVSCYCQSGVSVHNRALVELGPSRQARSRDPRRRQIIFMILPPMMVPNSTVLSTSHHTAAISPLGLASSHRGKPAGPRRLPSALPSPGAVHGSAGPLHPGQWVAARLTLPMTIAIPHSFMPCRNPSAPTAPRKYRQSRQRQRQRQAVLAGGGSVLPRPNGSPV